MNVVQIIQAEHRQVERLFDRFERAVRNHDRRAQAGLARDILRELSMHASVEEQVLYPALHRAGMPAEELDALEDHHAVKLALSELRAMTPEDERFAPKMHLIEKSTRLHIQEEETTILPRLGEATAPEELERLGVEFEVLRRTAPTRPHPAMPDRPPANIVTNATAAVADRLLDSVYDAQILVRAAGRNLVMSVIRTGRDAADRTRRNGEAVAVQARATGERVLHRARELGAELLEGAGERGEEVAGRIEQRTTAAARELAGRSEAMARAARRRRHRSPKRRRTARSARRR